MPSQLLPVAEKPPAERPLADCRIYERKACELPTTCQPASALEMKEMRWAATIVDISQGGVRILLQRRFEKGTGLAVQLPGDGQREPTIVFVKVVHLRRHDNGTYALGCKFISDLSEDEMQRLLTASNHVLSSNQDEHADDDPSSEAKSPETPKQAEIRAIENVRLRVHTDQGKVFVCTIKRLDVAKCWPLNSGKILSLNGKSRDQQKWSLRIKVMDCKPQPAGWEIQGRILGSPSDTEVHRALGA